MGEPHDGVARGAWRRCASADELLAELRDRGIDPMAVVSGFVDSSFEFESEFGVLMTSPHLWRIGNETADVELLVLLPDARARVRVDGQPEAEAITSVSVTLADTAIGVLLVVNPAVALARADDFGHAKAATALESDPLAFRQKFMARLTMGTIVHGEPVVARWRRYYDTDHARIKWIAREFTSAAKNLEDVEAAIGGSIGYVSHLGTHSATCLLRALSAYEGHYCTAIDWPRGIQQLLDTADPEMRDLLVTGRQLAFPALLDGPEDERGYFERLYAYCRTVTAILSRDEAAAEVLTSIIHDFDIIV